MTPNRESQGLKVINRRRFLAIALSAPIAAMAVCRQKDDTAYIQNLLDRGMTIPPGRYSISRPLEMRRNGGVIQGCTLIFNGKGSISFKRGSNTRITANALMAGKDWKGPWMIHYEL